MRVDPDKSVYHEAPDVERNFNRAELRRCRMLLRRLRFLEDQIRRSGGLVDGGKDSGGAAFTEWEAEALEWALKELEFLPERNALPTRPATSVSGN